MFIGGSPASTAGGIKTTTLFTLIKTVFGSATGREVTTQKRRISEASQSKAFMLFFVVASSVITGTLLLLLFDKTPVGDTLFLVMSASTNTGFSTIALEDLSLASHLVLVVLMFVGRVGPFTVIMAFNHNWYKRGAGPITYLEESIIIG